MDTFFFLVAIGKERRVYSEDKNKFLEDFCKQRLRRSINWKEGTFKQDKNKRCAFLNDENLCDMYTALGEKSLCRTCKMYPRHVDGESSDNLKGTDTQLELGSGTFIPGFEDQLIGVNAEDDVEVNVVFPDEYYEEVAGKDRK